MNITKKNQTQTDIENNLEVTTVGWKQGRE